MNRNHHRQPRSIGNFRRPRAVTGYAPVTLLGTSTLMPVPQLPPGARVHYAPHRIT